jgi:hypothetical protein
MLEVMDYGVSLVWICIYTLDGMTKTLYRHATMGNVDKSSLILSVRSYPVIRAKSVLENSGLLKLCNMQYFDVTLRNGSNEQLKILE